MPSASSPLPTNHFLPCSWHHWPEARGSSTALVPAAPPVPAHPSPPQALPVIRRQRQEPTCPGGGAMGWVAEAVEMPPGKSSPGHSSALSHCNLIVEVSSTSAHNTGRTEMPGWQSPAYPPICPWEAPRRTKRAQALESDRSEFEFQLHRPLL